MTKPQLSVYSLEAFIPQAASAKLGKRKRNNPKINSKNSQTKLFNLPEINLVDKNLWFKIAHWGKTTGSFSSFQNRFCYSLGQYITRKNNLTDKQKAYGNKLLQSALSKGFKIKE